MQHINSNSLSKYISKRALPKNYIPSDAKLFEKEFEREIQGSKAVEYSGIFAMEDTLFDLKSLSVLDGLTHPQPLSRGAKLRRIFKLYSKKSSLDKGLWISDYWGHNYFHWMTESLPRLASLDGAYKDYPIILPEELSRYAYVEASLHALGYTPLYLQKHEKIHVKKLISHEKTAPSFNFHEIAINKLRGQFRQLVGDPIPSRKIYISRLQATKRKITNEAELIPLLLELGYEIRHFDQMPYLEQLQLMAEATHLVGIHGAGLTNMLYMKEGGKVLEFRFAGDTTNNCFFSLASACTIDYYYSLNTFQTPKIHLNSDMILDMAATKAALMDMELKI